MDQPAVVEEPTPSFEDALAEAERSGRLFRTETDAVSGLSRVVYLTDDEVAEARRRSEEERPERELRAAEWMHGEKFARREQRDVFIHSLPAGHPLRVKAEAVEAAVAALGVRI